MSYHMTNGTYDRTLLARSKFTKQAGAHVTWCHESLYPASSVSSFPPEDQGAWGHQWSVGLLGKSAGAEF